MYWIESREQIGRVDTTESLGDQLLRKTSFCKVPLMATDVPVWPEDEERENRSLFEQRLPVPRLIEDDRSETILHDLETWLPERLAIHPFDSPLAAEFTSPACNCYVVSLPVSLLTTNDVTVRRVRLSLQLHDADGTEAAHGPIACLLEPGPQLVEEVVAHGELNADIADAVRAFWPGLPDVFSAKIGTEIDLKRIRRTVEATGRMSSHCEWRIADERLNYDFNPLLIVQVPESMRLMIHATLHVEARRTILGVFHKAYGISPDSSRDYVMNDQFQMLVAVNLRPDELPAPLTMPRPYAGLLPSPEMFDILVPNIITPPQVGDFYRYGLENTSVLPKSEPSSTSQWPPAAKDVDKRTPLWSNLNVWLAIGIPALIVVLLVIALILTD